MVRLLVLGKQSRRQIIVPAEISPARTALFRDHCIERSYGMSIFDQTGDCRLL